MFLVRNPEVSDHLQSLLLQLHGPGPAPSLQLGIEPEVLPDTQPADQFFVNNVNVNVLILNEICFLFCRPGG